MLSLPTRGDGHYKVFLDVGVSSVQDLESHAIAFTYPDICMITLMEPQNSNLIVPIHSPAGGRRSCCKPIEGCYHGSPAVQGGK